MLADENHHLLTIARQNSVQVDFVGLCAGICRGRRNCQSKVTGREGARDGHARIAYRG